MPVFLPASGFDNQPLNQRVQGSSPCAPTKVSRPFRVFLDTLILHYFPLFTETGADAFRRSSFKTAESPAK